MARNRRPRKFWTEADIERLRELYPDTPSKDIARALDRPLCSIHNKAVALGLRKSAEYLAGLHVSHLHRGNHIGAQYWFKPGQTPWNAGMKGLKPKGRAAETLFKKGNRSHTWKPIGSERIEKDGYLVRKVSDTGVRRQDWIGVHILVWKEHHGPVPKGYAVVFKNGNKRDFRIDNLELISRQELMRRNSIHRYPPELKRAIRLAAKLKRTIEEREHEKQAD